MNGTIVGIHILNVKSGFRFSPQLLSEKSLILRIQRDVILMAHESSWGTRYSCQISIKPEFSWQSFDKSSNKKFHENSSSVSRDVHADRQTWWHSSLFSVLRKLLKIVREYFVSVCSMQCHILYMVWCFIKQRNNLKYMRNGSWKTKTKVVG